MLCFFGGESQTFENILRYDNEIIDRDFILLRDFISWCNFDIEQDIAACIGTLFPSEKALRTRLVLSYRAQKKTLEYISKVTSKRKWGHDRWTYFEYSKYALIKMWKLLKAVLIQSPTFFGNFLTDLNSALIDN